MSIVLDKGGEASAASSEELRLSLVKTNVCPDTYQLFAKARQDASEDNQLSHPGTLHFKLELPETIDAAKVHKCLQVIPGLSQLVCSDNGSFDFLVNDYSNAQMANFTEKHLGKVTLNRYSGRYNYDDLTVKDSIDRQRNYANVISQDRRILTCATLFACMSVAQLIDEARASELFSSTCSNISNIELNSEDSRRIIAATAEIIEGEQQRIKKGFGR